MTKDLNDHEQAHLWGSFTCHFERFIYMSLIGVHLYVTL